jgi:hypothetical protein
MSGVSVSMSSAPSGCGLLLVHTHRVSRNRLSQPCHLVLGQPGGDDVLAAGFAVTGYRLSDQGEMPSSFSIQLPLARGRPAQPCPWIRRVRFDVRESQSTPLYVIRLYAGPDATLGNRARVRLEAFTTTQRHGRPGARRIEERYARDRPRTLWV